MVKFSSPQRLHRSDEQNRHWESYFNPVVPHFLIEEQKKVLFDTGLKLGDKTLKFVYTSTIARLEEIVQKEYDFLMVKDYGIALEQEIFYTMKIEGAKTTIARTHELRDGRPISKDNEYSERMTLNGFKAVKYLNLFPKKFDENVLLEVWRILGDGVCENKSIAGDKWRNGPVYIGSHEAISYEQINAAMAEFIDFYNGNILFDNVWLKALLLHFAFEYVHPFPDCNGRTGRMIMNKFLIDSGLKKVKAVSFTKQLDAERSRYDTAFIDSENECLDCTPFLEFGLQAMYRAMYNCNCENG